MMKAFADLHIHSALSPCGSDDMTPNNIVNMASLKGLHIIAVTDHNAMGNVEVIAKLASDRGILFVPGCEIQTREEIHLLCYFDSIDSAMKFQDNVIYPGLPAVKNNCSIFGNQLLFDKDDNIIGQYPNLLINSLDIGIEDAVKAVCSHGGVCVPAHIDKPSYSIISNLGFIPGALNLRTLEVSRKNFSDEKFKEQYNHRGYNLITSSDAHYLGDILEREFYLTVDDFALSSVIRCL